MAALPSQAVFNRLVRENAFRGKEPKYDSGTLRCESGNMSFAPHQAKDGIIRAKVKKL